MSVTKQHSRQLQYSVLFVGVIAISFGSIFIRLAQGEDVPSLVIAAWRLIVASFLLVPLVMIRHRTELSLMIAAEWRLATLSGILLAIHFAAFVSALALTSIISATVLVATVPIWVGLASPWLLNEPLSRTMKLGIALAILGTILVGLGEVIEYDTGNMTFSLSMSTGAENPLLGNVLALLAGIAAAGYMIIGRRVCQRFSFVSYTGMVYGIGALVLLAATWLSGQTLWGYSPAAYLLFLAMGLIPQLVGHTSFNWALSFLPAAFVSVAAISEPVGATLLGALIFAEIPGPAIVLGSIVILCGVFLASR